MTEVIVWERESLIRPYSAIRRGVCVAMETKMIKGVPTSRDEAVLNNLGLVRKIAYKYLQRANKSGIEFDELVNIGAIGLLKAFDQFDDSNDYQFSTYAYYKIRAEITRAIQNGHDKGIRYPVHIKEVASKIVKNDLLGESIDTVVSELKASRFWVEKAFEYLNTTGPVRLDDKCNVGNSHEEGHFVSEIFGKEEDYTVTIVKEFLSFLTETEKDIVMCFMSGINNTEMARMRGFSRYEIKKYKKQIREKLSDYMDGKRILKEAAL